MKILVLNYEYPPLGGGGAAVTHDLCIQASADKNTVDVITMGFKGLPSKEEADGIRIHRIKCWRSKQRVCHPWEQLSFCMRAFAYIKKNLNMAEYDFIHCHFIIPTGLLALRLNKAYDIPYIVTAHGSDVLGHNNSRFALLYKIVTPLWKKILRKAAAVTAPSPYLVQKIHESYSNLPVTLVPNGIHTSLYTPRTKEKYILVLTRLQESKGIQDLINAMASIELNGWKAHILGDGPYRKDLEDLARTKGLAESVIFYGHTEGVQKISQLSHAGCFFSGSHFEAFPVSVLEATLSGCFIIASAISPHIQLCGTEHTYTNKEELKKLLAQVVKENPKTVHYKENERYDWKNIYAAFKDVYAKVVK